MAVLTYWRTESGIIDRGGSCAGRCAAKRRSAQTRTHASRRGSAFDPIRQVTMTTFPGIRKIELRHGRNAIKVVQPNSLLGVATQRDQPSSLAGTIRNRAHQREQPFRAK